MKIALLGGPFVAVPPPAYGGTERVIDMQQHHLRQLGHDVLLLAPPGSVPAEGVELIENCEHPLYDDPSIKTNRDRMRANLTATKAMVRSLVAIEKVGGVDAVINHNGWFTYAAGLHKKNCRADCNGAA